MNTRPTGIAKIVTNDGDGAYTITQLWWNVGTGKYVEAGADERFGIADEPVRDYLNRATGFLEDIVTFWRTPTIDTGTELVCDVGNRSFVKAVVPAVRDDDCAWINTNRPHVFGRQCNSRGGFADLEPTPDLSSATASQFSKIFLTGNSFAGTRGSVPNVRADDIIEVTWQPGAPFGDAFLPNLVATAATLYDLPIRTELAWGNLSVTPTPPAGWILLDGEGGPVREPSIDLDNDGDVFGMVAGAPAGPIIDSRQNAGIGAGTNSSVPGAGLAVGHQALVILPGSGSQPSQVDLALRGRHDIIRFN